MLHPYGCLAKDQFLLRPAAERDFELHISLSYSDRLDNEMVFAALLLHVPSPANVVFFFFRRSLPMCAVMSDAPSVENILP